MKVLIVDDYPAFIVEIYVYSDDGSQIAVYSEGRIEWYPHEHGAKPEQPTIRLDKHVYEAIVREILGPAPSEEVLKDTRMIRDRLLTMVEQEWQSKTIEQK